jgi:transcription antitermination factor NusG
MPILRKESDIFPDDSIFAMRSQWEIVHVRSRQEKLVARILRQREQPYYLPQIEKTVRRSGRSIRSYLPLFSGYIFVRSMPSTRQALWSTGAMVQSLSVADQDLLTAQLRQIRTLQLAGAILIPLSGPAAGDAVRVTEGVFRGYTGVVVREADALRLVVSIDAVGKSVLAEFPATALKSVRPGSVPRSER